MEGRGQGEAWSLQAWLLDMVLWEKDGCHLSPEGQIQVHLAQGRFCASCEPVALASQVVCVVLCVVCDVLFSGEGCPGLCQIPDGVCECPPR